MTTYHENNLIVLRSSKTVDVVGDGRSLTIPAGSTGTVVLVHGDVSQPVAYEVEFYIAEHDCYALATLEAKEL
jgi:hypothetical protein